LKSRKSTHASHILPLHLVQIGAARQFVQQRVSHAQQRGGVHASHIAFSHSWQKTRAAAPQRAPF
jgi:hypothetical protein